MANEDKKYPTPRGASATSAKRKYNAKAYDRFELPLPKGMKEKIDEVSAMLGYKSRRSFILDLIKDKYKEVMGKELILDEPENKESLLEKYQSLLKQSEDDIPEKYKALMIPPDDDDEEDDEDLPF